MFDNVKRPQEFLLDAQIISHFSRQVRQKAQSLSTNVQTFDPSEFAQKLVMQLSGGSTHPKDVKREHWVHMGR